MVFRSIDNILNVSNTLNPDKLRIITPRLYTLYIIKNIIPVNISVNKYLLSIFFLQCTHFPPLIKYDKTGICSNNPSL